MQYFRAYSRGRQLMFFLLLILTFFLAASFILSGLISKIYGIDIAQLETINESSPHALIQIALLLQGISSLLVFFIPAYVFAYLAHPDPMGYLGLKKPGKTLQPFLVVLAMLGVMPVLMLLEGLIGKIDFGEAIRKSQQANDDMMAALLNMPNIGAFFKAFVVMAVIPGVGEEVFFRGLLMRFTKMTTGRIVFSIFFTALIFAMAHSNIYGYLSIFLAGSLLGFFYYITGSLWCSILAHICFNGSQVVLSYLGTHNDAIKHFMEANDISALIPWAIGGAIIFSI